MPVEEQTQQNGVSFFLSSRTKQGQRLTISSRSVSKLAFILRRWDVGPGDVYFSIRRVSDDSLIVTKLWGEYWTVPQTPTWLEVTFDSPVLINEEVRICVEGTFPKGGNKLGFYLQTSDVKGSEILTMYGAGIWTEPNAWDAAYRYTYIPVSTPTVTTNPATSVVADAATLNGTLDDDGNEACDVRFQYGETIAYGIDTEWQSGKESVVDFEQAITGLDPNKTYHFRAQAKNSAGTVNGADRTFTTLVALPTVSTDPATNVKEASATLNGTLDDDGEEACEVRFQYGLTTDYGTNTDWQAGKETDDTFSQAIVELVGGNLYHFRAQAKNSAGTANGNDRTLATITPTNSKRAYALSREEL